VNDDQTSRDWYSRGYLPHYDAGDRRTQFITCRLFDSLPQELLHKIKEEIRIRKPEKIERETVVLAEKYLDQGHGECFLRRRDVAEIVRDSIKKFDLERYRLFAWVIMPNHVHLLLRPLSGNLAREDRSYFQVLYRPSSQSSSGAYWSVLDEGAI